MGKSYGKALGSSLKYFKATKVDLEGNYIGTDSTLKIIENIPETTITLDLSKNKIGTESVDLLIKRIDINRMEDLNSVPVALKIQNLNLSFNTINPSSLKELGLALHAAGLSLTSLRLAQTGFNDESAEPFLHYIASS